MLYADFFALRAYAAVFAAAITPLTPPATLSYIAFVERARYSLMMPPRCLIRRYFIRHCCYAEAASVDAEGAFLLLLRCHAP